MSEKKHILVVDDEQDMVELLEMNLSSAGYRTSSARTGREALRLIEQAPPDLAILDIMMPELSGIEVLSRVRSEPSLASIPIIILTAKGEEVDELVGLSVGADDYIAKPFSHKVLLARIEALLRRSGAIATTRPSGGEDIKQMGPVRINTSTHEATLHDEPMKLTLTEFRVLAALIEAGGRVLTRGNLIATAIGPGITVTERTIDVHVTAIRKKLGEAAGMVQTVRGVGYRVSLPDREEPEEPEGSG